LDPGALRLELDPIAATPLVVQIARGISDAVRLGRLKPDALLPGTRTLARELRVDRNTVAAAYAELRAEGWVTARRGHGTRINRALPEQPLQPHARKRAKAGFPLPRAPVDAPQDEPLVPGLSKWDFGVPDTRLAPRAELARGFRRALRDGRGLLDYSRYRAQPRSRLHHAILQMLEQRRGLSVAPEQLVLTRGSQMGLYLLARTLIGPGDAVALENPGYWAAAAAFRAAGARVLTLSVDAHGLDVDALRRLCHRERRLRAVFVTPHHQFPTTVPLSAPRRLALLSLAQRQRFAVIEDDFDHEFHYQGHPLLPLICGDSAGVVLYLGSLSKVFGPGLRLGYLVAPEAVAQRASALRALVDLEGDAPVETAFAELFEDGEMQRHLNRARRVYAARRDFLVGALRQALPSVLRFEVPNGGMALWAEVEAGVDLDRWAVRARAAGLIFRTGRLFCLEGAPRHAVRLGFARWNEAELSRAVKVLKASLPGRG
jgi:GntR family transcriptional regulator/MocR family aminotransferase